MNNFNQTPPKEIRNGDEINPGNPDIFLNEIFDNDFEPTVAGDYDQGFPSTQPPIIENVLFGNQFGEVPLPEENQVGPLSMNDQVLEGGNHVIDSSFGEKFDYSKNLFNSFVADEKNPIKNESDYNRFVSNIDTFDPHKDIEGIESICRAISGYLIKILTKNPSIEGKTGRIYPREDIISNIIEYLNQDQEIFKGVTLTNHRFSIQANVFLLGHIRNRLKKEGFNNVWEKIYEEIITSLTSIR